MDLYIFDLDGTLIDSKGDLVQAVNASRAHLHLPPLSDEKIASYVGNGAPTLIRRALGPDAAEEQVAAALQYFLDYYAEHRVVHTTVYDGVRETLDELDRQGKKQAVLTNKPVRISHAILDDLDLLKYFFRVYGGNSFPQKKPDPVGIETLLVEAQVDRRRAIMIGDSAVDIQTARNAGICSVGVTFGFQPETLQADPPDLLIGRMPELLTAVLKFSNFSIDRNGGNE